MSAEIVRSELDIEVIIEMIIKGETYRNIANHFNVPLSTLHYFISKPEHSARVNIALQFSADTSADQAEEVLITAKGTMTEVTRAKELAQFYKWKASKRYPKRYSDKTDIVSNGETLTKIDVTFPK